MTPARADGPMLAPDYTEQTRQDAERFNASAKGALAPVYPALAEWLVQRYKLEKTAGIGIDLGGGPGDLIVELCARTQSMFWLDADINTYNFRFMYAAAAKTGVEHRVGAIFADAHALPFKDGFADIVVSRGTFQFWHDKPTAFREIYRVLKPGGVAFIGRGYSENLPVATAVEIRKKQGDGGPKYEVSETAAELRGIMSALGITDFEIIVPAPANAGEVKYGVWLEFRKHPR